MGIISGGKQNHACQRKLLCLIRRRLRRRIGTKEISPVELLEACMNASLASTRRSTPSRRRAMSARGTRAGPRRKVREMENRWAYCTVCRQASWLRETAAADATFGSQLYRDFVPEHDSAMCAAVRAAGASSSQNERAGIRRRRQQPQTSYGARTGNPFDPMLTRRSSGGSGRGARL